MSTHEATGAGRLDILRVRVDALSVCREPLDDRYSGWGGRGLTAKLLSDEVPPACSPLGPANKLILANGLLAGTRTSSAGRLSVGAKSPLTLGIKESSAGGLAGDAMARLGLRAIVLEGEAAPGALHLLRVGDGAAELIRADDLRGLGTYALCNILYERYGRDIALICIGPAGEHRLPVAGVAVNDANGVPSRYAGRGGTGAIMGAKGIKAIILEKVPGGRVPVADERGLAAARKRFSAALRDHPVTGQGFPLFGTVMVIDLVRALGGLPVRNFSQGDVEGEHAELSSSGFRQMILDRGGEGNPTHACMPGCVIRCSNVFPDERGKAIVSPLEYESLVLLGSNLRIYSVGEAAHLNYLCNDYGIDTMESGVALGVAMEAGVLPFGDYQGVVKLLGEIAAGDLMGRVLGQGAAVAGRVLGVERVPTVKGQAISAYDPRAVKNLGVTYATSPMGADHTAAGFTPSADPHSPEDRVQISRNAQVIRAGLDAVGICNFVMSALTDAPDILADLINAVHGTSYGPDLLAQLGREVLRMELAFNRSAGFTAAQDALPEFMTTEPLPPFDLTFDMPQGVLAHTFDGIDEEDARRD